MFVKKKRVNPQPFRNTKRGYLTRFELSITNQDKHENKTYDTKESSH